MALPELFANDKTTTLSAAIVSTGATTLTVASSTGFPAAATAGGQFRIRIDDELMIVTNVSGTTWTVTRGAESTTAATHSSGATVSHVLTQAVAQAIRMLLARTSYNPGSVTVVSSTSTTSADVDATNVAVTFTFPPSGAVDVTVSALGRIGNNNTGGSMDIVLRSGASEVSGTRYRFGGPGGINGVPVDMRFHYTWRLTGTAGTQATYKLGLIAGTAGQSVSIIYGPDIGPVVMEVFSA